MWLDRWLFAGGARPVLMREVPDAGGSGGTAPEGAAGGDAGGNAGDASGDVQDESLQAAAGEHAGQSDEDDEFDDTDPNEFEDLKRHPQGSRILKRNEKLNRFAKHARPLVQALRAMGIDPKKDPDALARLIHNSRAYEESQRATRETTRERRDQPPPRQTRADLPEDTPFAFDESALPWDRNDPGAKALIDVIRTRAEEAHHLRLDMNRIVNAFRAFVEKDFAPLRDGYHRERSAQAGQRGKAVVDQAVGKIADPELQEEFRYAVYGRLEAAKAQGRRLSVDEAVDTVLKRFTKTGAMSTKEAARVAAGQQQIAERNRTLPRPQSMVGGRAASPAADRSDETIWDVNKRLFGRSYSGGR